MTFDEYFQNNYTHQAPDTTRNIAEDAWLAAREHAASLELALQLIVDSLPTNRNWLDPMHERFAKEVLAKATGTSK